METGEEDGMGNLGLPETDSAEEAALLQEALELEPPLEEEAAESGDTSGVRCQKGGARANMDGCNGKPSKSHSLSTLFCLGLIWACLPIAGSTFTAYDCGKLSQETLYEVPKSIDCQLNSDMQTHAVRHGKVEIWGPKPELPKTTAYACSRILTEICSYESFFGSQFVMSVTHKFSTITAAACWNVTRHYSYQNRNLKPDSSGVHFATNVAITPVYGGAGFFCCGSVCKT